VIDETVDVSLKPWSVFTSSLPTDTAGLTTWSIRNFKSVRKADLVFGQLTLLVGANSAGKSAVLQSILMVAQSVQSGASTGMFGLNGPLVNLGTYEDIQHADSGDEVFLSLEMYPGGDFDALYNGAIRWGALIASPGGGSRGSAVIKGVVLENGYDDFTLGLARQSGEMKTVHFIPSSPRKLAESHEAYGAYTGSLQCDEQHGTTGTDSIGAARFAGVFPVSVGLASPVVGAAVRLWIAYIVHKTSSAYSAFMPGKTPFFPPALSLEDFYPPSPDEHDFRADSALSRFRKALEDLPPSPPQMEDALDYITRRLIAALEELKVRHSANSEWPILLLDDSEGGLRRRWTTLITAITFARDRDQRSTATDHGLDERSDADGQGPGARSRVNEAWHEFGRACYAALTEQRETICAAVDNHFDESGVAIVEPSEETDDAHEMIDDATTMSKIVAQFFTENVLYLGPLREDPHPVSARLTTPDSTAIGTKGEYTPAVLLSHDRCSSNPVPRPVGDDVLLENGEFSLRELTQEWLQAFGVAQALHVEDTSFGPVLRVRERENGKWVSLNHVGVGVSQLLPVIVLCLMTPPGSVILLEQPELHLHPALQQRLGDFLLACARAGRQLIVETHSEHIVSRLRRRIAETPDDGLVHMVRILFAEKNEHGETEFRHVQPNEYGGIEDWPKGFFDQSASEAQEILRAAVRKRKAKADGETARDGQNQC